MNMAGEVDNQQELKKQRSDEHIATAATFS